MNVCSWAQWKFVVLHPSFLPVASKQLKCPIDTTGIDIAYVYTGSVYAYFKVSPKVTL